MDQPTRRSNAALVSALWSMSLLAIAIGVSGCCCFGDLSTPRHVATEADDPAITRAAREYLEQHARELLGPASTPPDGGSGSSDCEAAILSIAATIAVPVITRGHAGSETAAEAWFHVGPCLARVRIVVQWSVGTSTWIVIGAETLVGERSVATLGTPVHVTSEWDDFHSGSDEMF